VLYEEDSGNPRGKQYAGSATWRTETVSPGSGLAPELQIRADVTIPERNMTVTWSLRRNTDQALPASHTIEIMFNLPPDFPGGGVANVPAVRMKESEQASGMRLAGLTVKVTNGFFLIGLSAVDADVQQNMQLLKERPWFGIRILYNNGGRAILKLEKGPSGHRAFADAFAAWDVPLLVGVAVGAALSCLGRRCPGHLKVPTHAMSSTQRNQDFRLISFDFSGRVWSRALWQFYRTNDRNVRWGREAMCPHSTGNAMMSPRSRSSCLGFSGCRIGPDITAELGRLRPPSYGSPYDYDVRPVHGAPHGTGHWFTQRRYAPTPYNLRRPRRRVLRSVVSRGFAAVIQPCRGWGR
jgi:hypothetical protein